MAAPGEGISDADESGRSEWLPGCDASVAGNWRCSEVVRSAVPIEHVARKTCWNASKRSPGLPRSEYCPYNGVARCMVKIIHGKDWPMVKRLVRGLEAIGSLMLVSIEVLLVIQVFCRFSFSMSLPWIEELARYSHIWVVFLGSVIAVFLGTHVKIDFFTDLLPKRALAYVEFGVAALGLAFSVVFLSSAVILVSQLRLARTASIGMPFPIFFLPVVVGGALLVFAFLCTAVGSLRTTASQKLAKHPTPEKGGHM